ncbi:MAG: hypothetical protein R3E83_00275 [Burkholderiaceae bacterium]
MVVWKLASQTRTHVRAAIAEREQGLWMTDHLVQAIERTAQVVEDREVDQVSALAGCQVVDDCLEHRHAARLRLRRE